jgi:hypothetical protein
MSEEAYKNQIIELKKRRKKLIKKLMKKYKINWKEDEDKNLEWIKFRSKNKIIKFDQNIVQINILKYLTILNTMLLFFLVGLMMKQIFS